ncbi:MAG TPA: hydrogenase assembly protein HupF [Candidatus Dormibacteraeota bacterium]|jgi:hydrogenase maturation factor|nr:hydrogenase assembly protein HupF [Candidatus Dormibacteraeota bacterium]
MSTECHDEVCITCSDQLLEMVVTDVDEAAGIARGTIDGTHAEVGIELLDGVTAGDVLLCHGGVALQRGTLAEVGT